MTVKLLTEHHLEFLGLIGGCTRLSESTLVKTSHCWKSHDVAHLFHETGPMHYLPTCELQRDHYLVASEGQCH